MVQVSPIQSNGDEGMGLSEGLGKTFTMLVAVPIQPKPSLPETLYTLLAAGINDEPFRIPPVQVYELAPEAVSVVEFPAQRLTEAGFTEIVGFGFTETVTSAVAVPQPLAPMTE